MLTCHAALAWTESFLYGLQVALPAVFTAPIRNDIVRSVHTSMAKNARQAYAVSAKAGHQTAAESWGTGRAVSRIPRVPGGGTHRAGRHANVQIAGRRLPGPRSSLEELEEQPQSCTRNSKAEATKRAACCDPDTHEVQALISWEWSGQPTAWQPYVPVDAAWQH